MKSVVIGLFIIYVNDVYMEYIPQYLDDLVSKRFQQACEQTVQFVAKTTPQLGDQFRKQGFHF